MTSRLSNLQNRHVLPALNQHNKSAGGVKDWILKFKCPVPGCQFNVTWCKINEIAFSQNWPELATKPFVKGSGKKAESLFFLETCNVHTCTDREAEAARNSYKDSLNQKRVDKKIAIQSPGAGVPKARVIDRFQAQLKIVTMYPYVEKLLLTDPDMSSDGIACAVSLVFGFPGDEYKSIYFRRINESVALFQSRWPGLRLKTRRAPTKGNPISNRGVIYKPDPNLKPDETKTHKAFGNVVPKKRPAKQKSNDGSSGSGTRQRVI